MKMDTIQEMHALLHIGQTFLQMLHSHLQKQLMFRSMKQMVPMLAIVVGEY
jgi:hypothetical protein